MKRFAVVALLVLCGCATPLDKPTQDGLGIGITTALILSATVPIATPLWVIPVGGTFAGAAARDYQREHQ